jgi:hypothetical protein
MKTAMQEAIELVKEYNNRIIPYNVLLGNLELLLEKEKEQMIVFGKKMQLVQHVSYDDDITYCFEPEEYYNQTYNKPIL